jgi:hypothetical protein
MAACYADERGVFSSCASPAFQPWRDWSRVRVGPHRPFNETPIILGGYPDMPLSAGQQVTDAVPLIIPKPIAAHQSAPNSLTAYESGF